MSVIWLQKTHGVQQRQVHKERTLAAVLFVALVVLTLLAGAYLALMARNTYLAQDIWSMEKDLAQFERANRALEIEIATWTRIERLQERARQLGYKPADQVDYMVLEVPGAQP